MCNWRLPLISQFRIWKVPYLGITNRKMRLHRRQMCLRRQATLERDSTLRLLGLSQVTSSRPDPSCQIMTIHIHWIRTKIRKPSWPSMTTNLTNQRDLACHLLSQASMDRSRLSLKVPKMKRICLTFNKSLLIKSVDQRIRSAAKIQKRQALLKSSTWRGVRWPTRCSGRRLPNLRRKELFSWTFSNDRQVMKITSTWGIHQGYLAPSAWSIQTARTQRKFGITWESSREKKRRWLQGRRGKRTSLVKLPPHMLSAALSFLCAI